MSEGWLRRRVSDGKQTFSVNIISNAIGIYGYGMAGQANAMAVGVVVLISKYGHEPISKRVFNMHPPASSNAVMQGARTLLLRGQ